MTFVYRKPKDLEIIFKNKGRKHLSIGCEVGGSNEFISESNLHKSFGKKSIICGFHFNVEYAGVVSILGRNGAGKTTLTKLMTAILEKTGGNIYYKDKDISSYKQMYCKDIGVVLEGDRNIYWYLTAMENLFYFGSLLGMNKTAIIVNGHRLLRYFGLYDSRDLKVLHYSRGMKQKLSIIITEWVIPLKYLPKEVSFFAKFLPLTKGIEISQNIFQGYRLI